MLPRAIKNRLIGRSDTEMEQALLRVLIGISLSIYLPNDVEQSSAWFYASGAYLAVIVTFVLASFAIVGCIFAWPQVSPARRVIANVLDIVTIIFIMIGGDDHTAPVFSVYLWITFGCGFRYGARYLLASLALSTIGFIIVLCISDYWILNRKLGVGLLVGMILLSLYVAMLVRRLYEALEKAAAANQAKRTFVSSVSHELRTPLNAIIGMNDLLRATALNAEQSEMANAMHSASRVMLSLIEDVLDFSKIEAGKLSVEPVDFDLHSLVQGILTIFSRQAALKGLKLGIFVMPDVPPALTGDAHHLQQVLVNLIGNAVKFTEHGSVQLAVSVLTDSEQVVRLRFAVRDTGIGIPHSDQERVFESFAQAGSPSVRKYRGTGLGTTISKQLVELMGGTIGLESAPGAGSTFWFDLPFVKQEASAALSSARFNGRRVMLIGFPATVRQELAESLRQWEMESSNANDSLIAAARLSEAAALGRPYSIALLYADSERTDIALAASELGARDDEAVSLILCAPRNVASTWGNRVPAEFASVIGVPLEKRLLYNALHSVLAGEATNPGVVSLADYYRRKEPTKVYRVLVADDDQINRKVISKQLEMAGHQVKLVADGEQALDALEEADYDLIILDSNMPVMTGLEATRLIRVMQAGRAQVPVILFSADATPETIQEAVEAGVNVFLPKPVEASRLYSTIEQLLGKPSLEASATVQAITPKKPLPGQLLDVNTLRDLEHMSQDPQFVRQLAGLFREDSSQILVKIEDSLAQQRPEELKAHLHALRGSALNLGAERVYALCTRIGQLDLQELDSSAASLAAEIRAVIKDTQVALDHYVKNRSGAAGL